MTADERHRDIAEKHIERARVDLERARQSRLVGRALLAGSTPETVANSLGLPLDVTQRVSRRIRAGFDPETVSPAEVINLRVVGEIGEAEMMRRLGERTYTAGMYDPTGGDGYSSGTWDEIQSAARQGSLTAEQYDWLFEHAEIEPQVL